MLKIVINKKMRSPQKIILVKEANYTQNYNIFGDFGVSSKGFNFR
jgi:hypothetical protein